MFVSCQEKLVSVRLWSRDGISVVTAVSHLTMEAVWAMLTTSGFVSSLSRFSYLRLLQPYQIHKINVMVVYLTYLIVSVVATRVWDNIMNPQCLFVEQKRNVLPCALYQPYKLIPTEYSWCLLEDTWCFKTACLVGLYFWRHNKLMQECVQEYLKQYMWTFHKVY